MSSGKVAFIFFALLAAIANTNAQKLWDGEAGDNQWHSSRNWYPDGVPSVTDDVILDNSILHSSYIVNFPPSTSTIQINSIFIGSKENNKISLSISELNTASPALTLSNIVIAPGGELINNSGANAGNTFSITGSIKIENGGRYIHRTMRGNAYLVSKLIFPTGTEKGIFEFDTPGTGGYIISMSGKSFGTLILSANKAAGKKTYSGSGNTNFVIHGNLQIEENVTFISSLNASLCLNGDFLNRGNTMLNPVSADSIGRELIFTGDSSHFLSSGEFSQNGNFRKIKIDSTNYFKLSTPLILSQESIKFEVAPNSYFNPDTSYLQGGIFTADRYSIICVSSPDGISKDINKGIIRTNSINIDSTVSINFITGGIQSTGNAFPEKISTLLINKPMGDLSLYKDLHVCEKIILLRGNIISTEQSLLTFTGTKIMYDTSMNNENNFNENSYISGPFKYKSDTARMIEMPVGNISAFAPIKIYKTINAPCTYQVEFFNHKVPTSDSAKIYPLKKIDETSYWSIKKEDVPQNATFKESISVYRQNRTPIDSTEHPVIIHFNDLLKKWSVIANTTNGFSSKFITTIPTELKNGYITFGSLASQVLPIEKIYLNYSIQNIYINLMWINYNDAEKAYYEVTYSNDGKRFTTLKNIYPNKVSAEKLNHFSTSSDSLFGKYIQIVAINKDQRKSFSNIIYIRNNKSRESPYPNPSHEIIFFDATPPIMKLHFIIMDQNGITIIPVYTTENNRYRLDISSLRAGNYVLMLSDGKLKKSYPFIKIN